MLFIAIFQSKNPLGYQHHKAALKKVARVRDAVFDTDILFPLTNSIHCYNALIILYALHLLLCQKDQI